MSRKSRNGFLKNYFVNLPSNLHAHDFQQIKQKEKCASLAREGPGWAEQCELSVNGNWPLELVQGVLGQGGQRLCLSHRGLQVWDGNSRRKLQKLWDGNTASHSATLLRKSIQQLGGREWGRRKGKLQVWGVDRCPSLQFWSALNTWASTYLIQGLLWAYT